MTSFVVSSIFYVASHWNAGRVLSFIAMGIFGFITIAFVRIYIQETRWKTFNDCIEMHRKELKSEVYSKDKDILERMLDDAR